MADNKDLKKFRGGIRLESTTAPDNAETGALYFDSTSKGLKVHDGDQFNDVGSGSSGGLDTFYVEDFRAQTLDVTNSGDTKFIRSGSSLSFETDSDEISEKTLKITVGTSNTDYLKSPLITLNNKQKGKTCSISFYYKTDSTYVDGDMKLEVYNDSEATALLSVDIKKNTDIKKMVDTFTIPSSASNIHYRFKSTVTNGGSKYVYVDDVEMSQDPFVQADLGTITDWVKFTPSFPNSSPSDGSTPGQALSASGGTTSGLSGVDAYWRRVGSNMEITISVECAYTETPPHVHTRIAIPGGYKIADNDKGFQVSRTVLGEVITLQKNSTYGPAGSDGTRISPYDVYAPISIIAEPDSMVGSTSDRCLLMTDNTQATSTEFELSYYDTLQIHREWGFKVTASVPIKGWTSTNTHIVTPAKSNLTDWTYYEYETSWDSTDSSNMDNKHAYWRRVGDEMEIRFSMDFKGTISNTNPLEFKMPKKANGNYYKVDTSKLPDNWGNTLPYDTGSVNYRDNANTGTFGDHYFSGCTGIETVSGDTNSDLIRIRLFATDAGQSGNVGTHATALRNGSASQLNYFGGSYGSTVVDNHHHLTAFCRIPIEGWGAQDSNFLAALPMTKVQTKHLSGTVSSANTALLDTDMAFTNLTVGKYYRFTLVYSVDIHNNSTTGIQIKIHDGTSSDTRIARVNIEDLASNKEFAGSISTVFKSVNGKINYSTSDLDTSDGITGNGTKEQTYAILEELPMHEEVDIW